MTSNFGKIQQEFTSRLLAVRRTTPFITSLLSMLCIRSARWRDEFLDQYPADPTSNQRDIPREHYEEYTTLTTMTMDTGAAADIMASSHLVSLISHFDHLYSRILRRFISLRPSILNNSGYSLTYPEIVGFGSLDAVRQHCIDRFVSDKQRESHSKQIEYLESQIGCTLRPQSSEQWHRFVEATQRRHLFVHVGGEVSRRYLNICTEAGIDPDSLPKLGERLSVSLDYFEGAFDVVFEIGTLLLQVLWRRLLPDDVEAADTSLNRTAFELIRHKSYPLAIRLLEFGTQDIKKHASEESRLLMTLNLAQAYLWSGRGDRCASTINDIDASTLNHKFSLALAALRGQHATAKTHAQLAIESKEIHLADLCEWPIFAQFRDSEQFESLYHELTGTKWSPTGDKRAHHELPVLGALIRVADELELEKTSAQSSPDEPIGNTTGSTSELREADGGN